MSPLQRLRAMRTEKGESLAELQLKVCDLADALTEALKGALPALEFAAAFYVGGEKKEVAARRLKAALAAIELAEGRAQR